MWAATNTYGEHYSELLDDIRSVDADQVTGQVAKKQAPDQASVLPGSFKV